ncbi:unnamed protein product [Allacma fusca]|uniref:Uncharacterized protein n=1 Tax=Allacma fusca TaxID=39272 RepID=A0A8J2KVX4_9HEXA|nr:unnamed protein product [Allacma fusca]
MWVKRRVAAASVNADLGDKLPKEFLEKPELTNEVKLGAYKEARKKFLAEKKKLRKDFVDEALIKQKVHRDLGFIDTNCNEGAFALAEQRKKKSEAIRKIQREVEERLKKEENIKEAEGKKKSAK